MASEPPLSARARRAAAVFLKIAGAVLAVVVFVGAAGAAFVASRYFGAAIETELARSLLQEKRRTLRFEGPLEIFFWPNAGFRVGRMSLSEAGSSEEFAALDSARFSVELMPLFHGRIVVDDCDVEGLKAAIVKRRDGTLNIDDLFVSPQPSAARFTFDVAGISIRHAALGWTDQARGTAVAIGDLDLSSARLQADTAAKTLRADALALAGRIDGTRVRLAANGLAASPAAVAADRIAADFDYSDADTAVKGSLNARLAVDPQGGTIALEQLAGSVGIAHPRLAKRLELPLRGALRAGRDAARGDLATRFEESTATLKFAVPRYSPMTLHVDIDIDRLDVGRYLAPRRDEEPRKTTAHGSAMDFSALDGFSLEGTARIGSLQIAGATTRNIKLEIRSTRGKLDVRGVGAKGG